ncbi:MAG: hypothetical protein ACU0CO_11465 [Shimia sp.]
MSRWLGDAVTRIPVGKVRDAALAGLLMGPIEAARRNGGGAVIVDLAARRRLSDQATCTLVEAYQRAAPDIALVVVGAAPAIRRRWAETGADIVIPLATTLDRALALPVIARHRLARTRALLVLDGPGLPLAPRGAGAMVPICGRPLLERMVGELRRWGLRDIVLEVPEGDRHVAPWLARGGAGGSAIFRIGADAASGPGAIGAGLRRLRDAHFGVDGPILVASSNLLGLDPVALAVAHRAGGHHATGARRGDAPLPACLLGPEAAAAMADLPADTDATGALAALARDGMVARAVDIPPQGTAEARPLRVADAPSLAEATRRCLVEGAHGGPAGERIAPTVWAAPSARLSARADIAGCVHLGDEAEIGADAALRDWVALGAGARATAGSYLRRAMLWPETAAGAGAWIDGAIAHPSWALSHGAFSDGAPRDPLEGVRSARPGQAVRDAA